MNTLLHKLLKDFKEGTLGTDAFIEILQKLPYEQLSPLRGNDFSPAFARIDHHRMIRRNAPEVVYGEGKTAEQLEQIVHSMWCMGSNVLVTRIDPDNAQLLTNRFPQGVHVPSARLWQLIHHPMPALEGYIAVLTGGTLDIPVAEEAAVTAEFFGSTVKRFYDVGVAGIHRLFDILDDIRRAHCWVVVAGMEGALPSIVAGLVEGPVIAVPTSVGYGVHLRGVTPLLAALNSCSPGVVVVNVDNGFGGGYVASLIHRKTTTKEESP